MLCNGFSSGQLKWLHEPGTWKPVAGKKEGTGGGWSVEGEELVLKPDAKKDLWRHTYYSPPLVKDDAPSLLMKVGSGKCTVETAFTVHNQSQFDQGGVVVRLGPEHWIKTGIEVVDGVPRIGAVCTNVYADWSTSPWPSHSAALRVHILPPAVVVEAAPWKEGKRCGEWTFLRICRIGHGAPLGAWEGARAGVYGACPEDQRGCKIVFHNLSITRGSDFSHNADGNQEMPAKL
eukprot:Hpha_TRINITY_DN8169_c0_g1::TRINITY_DN8169_c0_g1_i1::g.171911::m.171911/K09702/K09702; uncharacterized protein